MLGFLRLLNPRTIAGQVVLLVVVGVVFLHVGMTTALAVGGAG